MGNENSIMNALHKDIPAKQSYRKHSYVRDFVITHINDIELARSEGYSLRQIFCAFRDNYHDFPSCAFSTFRNYYTYCRKY